jgi:hypothetical protein
MVLRVVEATPIGASSPLVADQLEAFVGASRAHVRWRKLGGNERSVRCLAKL